MTLKYSDVELDKIIGNKYKNHLLVNYENRRFIVQTDWMTLSHYGVPKCDKFHTTEESRRYLQIPLNDDNLSNFIHTLDNVFSSENFRNTYLNEKQRNFNYIPIFKEGKNEYPPSMKLKMNIFEDKILTEIIHKTSEGNQQCNLENMDDVKKCIPYKCEYKLIFKVNRIWFMSKNYGVQVKFMKALVKVKNKEEDDIDFFD